MNLTKISIEKAMISGVYFLYKDEKIVYVGASNHINNRIKQHIDRIDFNYYAYIEVPIQEKLSCLSNLEAYFVNKCKPEINKKMPYNKLGLTNEHLKGELKDPIDLNDNLIKHYGIDVVRDIINL